MLALYEIGGTWMRAGASPQPGTVAALGQTPTPAADFAAFTAALRALMPEGAKGLALSLPGGADPETGRMRIANLPCLDGRPLAADLRAALGLQVTLANDADCFALAEAVEGVGAGHRVVFGITLGTGLGGGLVIDGRIHAGAFGLAGEWGHGPLFPRIVAGRALPGLPCGCGQTGCLETLGSARGIERLHNHLHGGPPVAAEAILQSATADDPQALLTLAIWTEVVAGPLAMMLNVIGASVVPVGGGLSHAPGLVDRLDSAVRARVLHDPGPGLLRAAAVPGEPGMTGAAILGWRMLGR